MNTKILIAICIFIFSFGCKKIYNKNISLENLEQRIRESQDHRAVFTYLQYDSLLDLLDGEKYMVLPLDEFSHTYDTSMIMVGLRHDVDCHPFKAHEMAQMEYNHNFSASYYMLPTAEYYGMFKKKRFERIACMSEIYTKINQLNHETGMHNDLLTVMIEWGLDVKQFNTQEIEYFAGMGIPITGTAAHGSSIANETVPNYEIFKDFASDDRIIYKDKSYQIGIDSLKNFGYDYEAYFIEYNKYFSDGGGKWATMGIVLKMSQSDYARFIYEMDNPSNTKNFNHPNISFADVLNYLKNAVPGDRIVILTHPVYWGKE